MKPAIIHLSERFHLLAIAILMLGSCAPARKADQVKPPVLRDVMWQLLPANVRGVYVGPDGRTWWILHDSRMDDSRRQDEVTLAEVKSEIEAQFDAEEPVIRGSWNTRIVLFEPGGRVWFYVFGYSTLIGFDGKEWIEQPMDEDEQFLVGPPNHGPEYEDGPFGCVSNGHAFFLTTRHVYVWGIENKQMTSQLLPAELEIGCFLYDQLLPETDGEGVLVYGQQEANDAMMKQFLLHWREETGWREVELDELPANHEYVMMPGIFNGKPGAWFSDNDDLRFLQLDGGAIIQQSYAVGDIEFDAHHARLLYSDLDGCIYVGSKGMRQARQDLGPGIVALGPHAQAFRFGDESLLERWTYVVGCCCSHSRPMAIQVHEDNATGLWIRGRTWPRASAFHVDLETGAVDDEMPNSEFTHLRAVLNDGTVIASAEYPNFGLCPVAAYRSKAVDDRLLLRAEKGFEIGGGPACIAPDGTVYATTRERGVVHITPDSCTPVPGVCGWIHFIAPGADGSMLVFLTHIEGKQEDEYVFVKGDKVVRGYPLESFAFEHRKELIAAFPPRNAGALWYMDMQVFSDSRGNLWIGENKPKVIVGDKIIGIDTGIEEPRRPRDNRVVVYPMRNGVLLQKNKGNMQLADKEGWTWYVEIQDGKPVTTALPHEEQESAAEAHSRGAETMPVHAPDGTLWLPVFARVPEPTSGFIIHGLHFYYGVQRFGTDGSVSLHRGTLSLCDVDGNVWLSRDNGRFDIWCQGRIAHSVNLPYCKTLLSDASGSVWAWGPTGFHHLVAPDQAKPYEYSIVATYWPADMAGRLVLLGYSRLGFLVIRSELMIYFVRPPGKNAQAPGKER